jgi:hypothetical protein
MPSRIRVPAHFASDRECLQWVAATVGKVDAAQVTYGWIANTLEVDRVAISQNLLAQIDGQPHVEIEEEIEVTLDASGNLVSPLGSNRSRTSRRHLTPSA